jgi:hypothetical protein
MHATIILNPFALWVPLVNHGIHFMPTIFMPLEFSNVFMNELWPFLAQIEKFSSIHNCCITSTPFRALFQSAFIIHGHRLYFLDCDIHAVVSSLPSE